MRAALTKVLLCQAFPDKCTQGAANKRSADEYPYIFEGLSAGEESGAD